MISIRPVLPCVMVFSPLFLMPGVVVFHISLGWSGSLPRLVGVEESRASDILSLGGERSHFFFFEEEQPALAPGLLLVVGILPLLFSLFFFREEGSKRYVQARSPVGWWCSLPRSLSEEEDELSASDLFSLCRKRPQNCIQLKDVHTRQTRGTTNVLADAKSTGQVQLDHHHKTRRRVFHHVD